MALNNSIDIPSDEELTVPEVKLSGVVLRAGAFHLGKYCENYNNEYMLCRNETEDASACINEGKAVTNCTLEFFRMVKRNCAHEFQSYYRCVDRSSSSYRFTPCRKTQNAFDSCMFDNYDLERPAYGYFCRVKVHETDRPKPTEEQMIFNKADVPEKLPDDYVRGVGGKYGSRNNLFCT